ncbi:unnamed protein product [Clonostachys byssicola]|uniref:Uncharacterized protein n=1 Tax=Clonostachys byssicola TaxID=160290 RepID=A0A9N9U5G8_9HYPO|nr:unnamed protein product [Clonostachys byssicola]
MQANSMSSSTSGKPVFKNGNSSGKTTDLQQKKAEAEAEIEAARKKEEERIKEDLAAFKELKAEFSTLRKQLEEVNQKAEADRSSNEKEMKHIREKLELSQEEAQEMADSCEGYKRKLDSAQEELAKVKKEKKALERDEWNNLDPECHGRQFNIINVYARIALDFGADNGTRCHAWNWDPKNGSQPMTVERVNTGDSNSPWTIRSGNRYLELRDPSSGSYQPMCSARRSGSEARNQEWLIGFNGYRPGHYWLWNEGQRCYLKLVSGDLFKNG